MSHFAAHACHLPHRRPAELPLVVCLSACVQSLTPTAPLFLIPAELRGRAPRLNRAGTTA
jgi:hypothetical protein